jgi:hypothetical protein
LADRRVIDSILEVDDEYPYIRGLVAQTGVKSDFVEYNWGVRAHGKSRNSILDLVDQALNGFISTSRAPARIAMLFGIATSMLGIFAGLVYLILSLTSNADVQPGIPTLIVGLFLFGGLQLFFLGLIGEYILSIHGQVKRRPPMFEVVRVNFDDNQKSTKRKGAGS